MDLTPADLQAYLLAIRETGALEFGCSAFTVRFPAEPEPVEVSTQVVPPAQRVVSTPAPPESGYHKLFHGQMPTFKRES